MAKGCTTTANAYEDERKKKIEENNKRLQELGIAKVAKSLSDVVKMEKQSPAKKQAKPRVKKTPASPVEVRRSSRERKPVSYKEEFVDDHLRGNRLRSSSSFNTSYLGRPEEEIRFCTYKQRCDTMEHARIFQSELKQKSEHPSCVKSMLRSHVYSCFWLGLPKEFCDDHLSKDPERWEMVLVDEEGIEYDTIYIPKRTGLSGGWKAFALYHKLDDGDAVVFELIEPAKSKAYIFRVNWGDVDGEEVKESSSEDSAHENTHEVKVAEIQAEGRRTRNSKRIKSDTDNEDADESMSKVKDVARRGKRVKMTDGDSDDSMNEEKGVLETRARGRTGKTKGIKKSDADGEDADEKMSEEMDVKATGRRTRNSRRGMKSATAN